MKPSRLFAAHLLFALIPPTRGFALKRALLRWCGADVADDARIVSSARFHLGGALMIGRGAWIGHQVLMVGGEAAVTIGAEVDIAPRVTIVTGSHRRGAPGARAAGQASRHRWRSVTARGCAPAQRSSRVWRWARAASSQRVPS